MTYTCLAKELAALLLFSFSFFGGKGKIFNFVLKFFSKVAFDFD